MGAHTVRNPVPTPEEMAELLGVELKRLKAIREIMSPLFVERTPQGKYAVKRRGSPKATAVLSTQAEAIKRAKELKPNSQPVVERVRNSANGDSGKWRRAS